MPFEPGRLIGVFEIVGPLAAGGMGEVYRARDTRLPRDVAIKVVTSDLGGDASAAKRLIHEARIASSLNHPNIVTVLDVGEVDGHPYVVMELVEGQSLHERMAFGALELRTAVDLACQMADGLAAAHEAHVIHRDLKPRNIMVRPDGHVKIVDFGLGRTAPHAAGGDEPTRRLSELTDEYAILGTAGYMAPEQINRSPVDFRADQFSLGVVIYEMLSGRRAFKRDTGIQTMSAILDSEPEPLAGLCPSAPAELITIVQRCLAKSPANRYASSRDLARDLHDVKNALSMGSWPSPWPTSAPTPAPVPAPRPWPRWWMWAAAALLVLVAAGAGVTYLMRPDPLEEGRRALVRHDRRADIERAVKWFERAVADDGDNPAALTALAEALVRQADPLITLNQRERDDLIARATDLCRRAQNLHGNDAAVHVVWAMINSAVRQFDGAVDQAEQAIKDEPENARAWQELGLAETQRYSTSKDPSQLEAAERALRKAIALAPGDWRARHLLGVVLLQAARWEEAAAVYEEAYALVPDSLRVLNNLGTAYMQMDQLDKAKGVYQQSLVVEPSFTAWSNLGTVLYEQQDYDQAISMFEEAVNLPQALQPQRYGLWRNLASACHQISRFKSREHEAYLKAAALAEAELKSRPTGLVKAALADTYSALGRMHEARALVAELEQRPPEDKDALFILATMHEQYFENRDKALYWLARARDAKYPMTRIERSPILKDLRDDKRYKERFKQ